MIQPPSPTSIDSSSRTPIDVTQLATKELAKSSPAAMAVVCSAGKWRATPHLLAINRAILRTIGRKDGRLILQVPVRHGKSELLSTWFPPWYLGENPDHSLIWLSYNQGMASKYGGSARNVFEQFAEPIWGLKLATDTHAKRVWNIAGHAGAYYSDHVSGGLGSRNANGIIIDDPFGSDKQASSKKERQRVWDSYRDSVYGRLEPGGWLIIGSARWHSEDLIGLILKAAEGNDDDITAKDVWELIDQPVYALEGDQLGRAVGEPLWPARFDRASIERRRRSGMSARIFSAQWMMRPLSATSKYFPATKFRYYDINIPKGWFILDHEPYRFRECDWFQCVDLAATKGGGDYFVIGTFARHRQTGMMFIVDVYRAQIAGPQHIPAMSAAWKKWPIVSRIHVEAVGMQKVKVDDAIAAGLPVSPFLPNRYGDKLSRADIASGRYDSGMVAHPAGRTGWLADLETELGEFPNGADDQVDVISMACILGAEESTDYAPAAAYRM